MEKHQNHKTRGRNKFLLISEPIVKYYIIYRILYRLGSLVRTNKRSGRYVQSIVIISKVGENSAGLIRLTSFAASSTSFTRNRSDPIN